jgi:hypothetical protein
MKKLFFILAIIGIAILVVRYFYFYGQEVDAGSAYGFEIGMSKDMAANAVSTLSCGEDCEVILSEDYIKSDVSGSKSIRATKILSVPLDRVNAWQIRYDGSDKNVLVLIFKKNRLDRMIRYRRAWIF